MTGIFDHINLILEALGMNLFDIVGPVMVGPSSSHTAGAVKIGLTARRLLDDDVREAVINFHGSFLSTGRGHGTDKAVVAGLSGMAVDDPGIPDAFEAAEKNGMTFSFGSVDLGDDAHPNSVQLFLTGRSGKHLELIAASVGGGQIEVREIDGLKAVFSGEHPTLIVQNDDTPGVIADVALTLSSNNINIATLQLTRDSRGGKAAAVIETDQEIPEDAMYWLAHQDGVQKVTYLSLKEK